MQVTQSWAFGNKAAGAGAGAGYRNDPVTLLVTAANDANPSPYNVVGNDAFIEVDASNQNVQIVLQNAAQCLGQRKRVKRVDASYAAANTVSIIDISGATIDGASSISLTAQNAVIELQSDGTHWQVIDGANSAAWGGSGAIGAITVGASPYTYTAPAAGTVFVSGGTDSALQLKRGATTIATGFVDGPVPVSAGDQVIVTYSVAPTMNFVPR
ncbi:hypothetical protein [Burkholderia cepacia]|uniref:hypothetical protein n=1 Tax=Burkholderia cepacia TaxID=292 RepID=UPI001CF4964D|nr:hypothetical protein [Burkholderia cepacia]MCA8326124.1 hypothetical protein [Burkholderia cepacia]